MGQAFFTREILKRFKPKTIKTVAICGKGDTEMEILCEKEKIEVVIMPESEKMAYNKSIKPTGYTGG